QLDLEMKDGSKALYFDWNDLALFDLFVLKREGAEHDYPEEVKVEAAKRYKAYSPQAIDLLSRNVLMGIPGERSIELDELRESIREYAAIGFDGLRQNLIWFLSAIADVCEESGIRMTIHPDDPPYPILGLPRIASNKEDR